MIKTSLLIKRQFLPIQTATSLSVLLHSMAWLLETFGNKDVKEIALLDFLKSYHVTWVFNMQVFTKGVDVNKQPLFSVVHIS